MPVKTSDIIIFRGNDAIYKLTVKLNGDPYDLTDCLLDFYVKRKVTEANADAVIHKYTGVGGIEDGDVTGIVNITINAADTLGLEIGYNFVYDIELTTATNKVYTILRGIFKLRQNWGEIQWEKEIKDKFVSE